MAVEIRSNAICVGKVCWKGGEGRAVDILRGHALSRKHQRHTSPTPIGTMSDRHGQPAKIIDDQMWVEDDVGFS